MSFRDKKKNVTDLKTKWRGNWTGDQTKAFSYLSKEPMLHEKPIDDRRSQKVESLCRRATGEVTVEDNR